MLLIDVWSKLPEVVKAGILMMVQVPTHNRNVLNTELLQYRPLNPIAGEYDPQVALPEARPETKKES